MDGERTFEERLNAALGELRDSSPAFLRTRVTGEKPNYEETVQSLAAWTQPIEETLMALSRFADRMNRINTLSGTVIDAQNAEIESLKRRLGEVEG